jgi:branched-chain amino acid transport system substrate-binding protein
MKQPTRRNVCLAAAGFAASRPGLARAAPKAVAAPTLVVAGVLLPLTGAYSLAGDECLRGIQLAADAVTLGGGRALSLVTGDAPDQGDAQAAAQGLINHANATLILGTGASVLSYPGSAAAELAQIPYIELTAPADGICTRGFKDLLRTGPTTSMIAGAATAALAQRFAGKKIGLLFNTGATGGAIAAAALSAWAQAKTPPLISIGYPEDTVDLNDEVGRLHRAGAEVILHAAGPADVLMLFAALGNAGWQPAVLGSGEGYALRETAYTLGAAFDGTLAVAAPFYPPRAAYIAAAYQARFGMPPRAAESLTAFVGAKLVFDILNAVGGDTTKLLDALRKTDVAEGTLANGFGVSFDKTGQNTRSFAVLQQWRGGVLVAV